jgi:hypothetical protein
MVDPFLLNSINELITELLQLYLDLFILFKINETFADLKIALKPMLSGVVDYRIKVRVNHTCELWPGVLKLSVEGVVVFVYKL